MISLKQNKIDDHWLLQCILNRARANTPLEFFSFVQDQTNEIYWYVTSIFKYDFNSSLLNY